MGEGLNEYRNDPILWAALVVLDHVERDDPVQCTELNLHKVLKGSYEFIEFFFEEEGFGKPSKNDIISRALEIVGE